MVYAKPFVFIYLGVCIKYIKYTTGNSYYSLLIHIYHKFNLIQLTFCGFYIIINLLIHSYAAKLNK